MSVQAVAIIIPARDEEDLIGRCLAAVGQAVARIDRRIAVTTTVVADDCVDGTEAIAKSFGAHVEVVAGRNVGAARAAGIRLALRRHAVRTDRLWLANTDADSVVPSNWLVGQLTLANAGWDAVVGTVRPDFAELSSEQIEAWQARHIPGVANGHPHGANLGIRASTYLATGGFEELALHEDTDLVARLIARRTHMAATAGIDVLTSGRQFGRAPGGYAQYLRDELVI